MARLKVQGHVGLVRDNISKAVINTNASLTKTPIKATTPKPDRTLIGMPCNKCPNITPINVKGIKTKTIIIIIHLTNINSSYGLSPFIDLSLIHISEPTRLLSSEGGGVGV